MRIAAGPMATRPAGEVPREGAFMSECGEAAGSTGREKLPGMLKVIPMRACRAKYGQIWLRQWVHPEAIVIGKQPPGRGERAASTGYWRAKRPPWSEPAAAQGVEARSGKALPVQVLESAAGLYLGTVNEAGPYSRKSQEYWRSQQAAEKALETGPWTARRNANPPPAEFEGSLERPRSRSR